MKTTPLMDDTQAIADELLCGEDVIRIFQHIEEKSATGNYDVTIRALFAGVYEALRVGIEAGIEHGIEITCDRIAATRPGRN